MIEKPIHFILKKNQKIVSSANNKNQKNPNSENLVLFFNYNTSQSMEV
jgi:hypothetical protein